MSKIIFITGATDGLGLKTAQSLAAAGHTLRVHGRSQAKADAAAAAVGHGARAYAADLTDLSEVSAMAAKIVAAEPRIDVLINNAGVFKMADASTSMGLDARFVVNLLAPYVLTQALLPLIPAEGRVVNLSSAAQAPVDLAALKGTKTLDDFGAYAQSKLGLTIWTQALAKALPQGPLAVSVNPGSYLATKMVVEGFGMEGRDPNQGVDILSRAALSPEFEGKSGAYFDNDAGVFSAPHPAASDGQFESELMDTMHRLCGFLSD